MTLNVLADTNCHKTTQAQTQTALVAILSSSDKVHSRPAFVKYGCRNLTYLIW